MESGELAPKQARNPGRVGEGESPQYRLIVGGGVRGLESTVPNRLQVIGDWRVERGVWSLENSAPSERFSAKGG